MTPQPRRKRPAPSQLDPGQGGRLPHLMQLRLGDVEARGVALLAHSRGSSMAAVVRNAIRSELERFEGHHGGEPTNLLQALERDLDAGLDELADSDVT